MTSDLPGDLATKALRFAADRRSMNGRRLDPRLTPAASNLATNLEDLAGLVTRHPPYQLHATSHPNSDPGRPALMVTVIGPARDLWALRDALTIGGWTTTLRAWTETD